jgi:acetoin utilization deacetylase AcuC-like enzyme
MQQVLVTASRDPRPKERIYENKPETRRTQILTEIRSRNARIELADAANGPAAIDLYVKLGITTADKMDFLKTVHAAWKAAPCPEPSFQSSETAEKDGIIPNLFVRDRPHPTAPWARRMAYHSNCVLTPIYDNTAEVLADDAAVCAHAVEMILAGRSAAYALTTHPGHHAFADFYGGFCFLNHAAFAFSRLRQAGKKPFLIDVDYHAGDGTASFLSSRDMVSLHALNDYPYTPLDCPYAIFTPPDTAWEGYEPLLREALSRRPPETDVLVLSLGFDTQDGDPCAAEGHRLRLQPEDFAKMRAVINETGLQLIVTQEGGYLMSSVHKAAAEFWLAGEMAAPAIS